MTLTYKHSEDEIIVLNPDYTLIHDVNRIYLITNLNFNERYSFKHNTFLHPVQAMIASFFTFERTLNENIKLLMNFLNCSEDFIRGFIEPLIENDEVYSVTYNEYTTVFPQNLFINIEKVKDKFIPLNIDAASMACTDIDLKSRRINSRPDMLIFMLNNTCVTKCCYCYANLDHKVEKYISLNKYIELIQEAKSIKVNNIALDGGEVFLHPHWHTILKEIMRNGFFPDIISTKKPIDNNIINKLFDLDYFNTLQLSIDSLNPEVLSKTLSVKKNYIEQIIQGINLLEANRIKYNIGTVLTKYSANKNNLDNLFKYFKTLKYLNKWEIRVAMPSLYKSDENFNKIKAPRTHLIDLYDYIEENFIDKCQFLIATPVDTVLNRGYYQAEEGGLSFGGATCSAMNNQLFILPDGQVTICEQLYWNKNFIVGNINEQNIIDIWNSPELFSLVNLKQSMIQKDSYCSTCSIFDKCFNIERNRCWTEIIKAYGEENWDYPDPRCNKAPNIKNSLIYS